MTTSGTTASCSTTCGPGRSPAGPTTSCCAAAASTPTAAWVETSTRCRCARRARAGRRQPGADGRRSDGHGRPTSARVHAAEHRARRRTRLLVVAARRDRRRRRPRHVRLDAARRCPSGQADLRANQAAQRLASSSSNVLTTDAELALLLAEQAIMTTAHLGYAVPEAIDATHWALQDLGVQYPVTADVPTAGAERADRRPWRVGPARRRPAGARRRRDHAPALRRRVPAVRRPRRLRPAIRRRQPRLPRGHRGVRRRGAARASRDRPRRGRVG